MKVFFTSYGYREVTNWSCPFCKNFYTSGMDLMVGESARKHMEVCPDFPKARRTQKSATVFECTSCGNLLTLGQAAGIELHLCKGEFTRISNPVPMKPEPIGYHNREIPRGTFGEVSKIREELVELEDAVEQGIHVMIGCELSDLYGALRGYAEANGFSMDDLEKMADVSKRVFESGYRKSRD